MRQWTYAEIRDKVQRDLDLQEEPFITPEEMRGYVNEAIDEAEAEIHNIYEDYFLTSWTIPMVAGQSDYALPTELYANKIRAVTFKSGSSPAATLKRSRDLAFIGDDTTGAPEAYVLVNPLPAAEGPAGSLIRVLPAPSGGTLTIWGLRNAQRLETDLAVCDIPEFVNFVIQATKFRCYEKEGHPNTGVAAAALDKQRKLMIDTLSEMVPDDDTFIPADTSFYWDHT